jgi:hypothetical protein
MDNCNLVEVTSLDGNFTWNRLCAGNHMVYHKLDKALSDVPWRMAFPDAYVEVLCKLYSDHNPLLL